MFERILIANRGEIACRVIRTARRMGVETVAVYSDADAHALHVVEADHAYRIGPSPARESYLVADKILEVAKLSGAQAIHPGYGFLSENAGFAEACKKAGIIFIGPPADAIRAMGSKSEAKALMDKAGVPLVPGYHGEDQDADFLAGEAERIGYPVLIKASAGGGGKGMRLVEKPEDFQDALASCKRESAASFGDDKVLIERYITKPRHIEMQVFADAHGNAVHLFERDCSIQRRHQKVVEEAPAPGMTDGLRAKMGKAACDAAKAIGYEGAGTVEFIAETKEDGAPGEFFFMEMNTRLQVEHPVTEMVTGYDLVEWQLRIASGETLPAAQENIHATGHALEVRLYAEDPMNEFLPATGQLHHLAFPEPSPHVRVDSGVRAGDSVSVHYDPMIAKLIVWDEDRLSAIRRLRQALSATEVAGLSTNRDFLSAIAAHSDFAAAKLDTGFIERHYSDLVPEERSADRTVLILAAVAELLRREEKAFAAGRQSADPFSPWAWARGWRLNDRSFIGLTYKDLSGSSSAGESEEIELRCFREGPTFRFEFDDATVTATADLLDGFRLIAEIDGRRLVSNVVPHGDIRTVLVDDRAHELLLIDPMAAVAGLEGGPGTVNAPMPGKVTALFVAHGDEVEDGQALMILEAMKMEHTIRAPKSGVVARLPFREGDQVGDGDALIAFED